MGQLRYGTESFEIDDRVLRHVQFVIGQKMRREERFMLSWSYRSAGATLRSSVWISGSSVLHFVYSGSREASLSQGWLELMMSSSHSSNGLDLDVATEPTS